MVAVSVEFVIFYRAVRSLKRAKSGTFGWIMCAAAVFCVTTATPNSTRAAEPTAATDMAGTSPSPASGSSSGAAASDFQRSAERAWKSGNYDEAERQYRIVIERGKLAPNDILEAYIRLGSARAVLGKRKEATAAFRAAGVLRNNFVLSPEFEGRVGSIADVARKDVAKIGSVHFSGVFPAAARANQQVHVSATLDDAHTAIVSRITLTARMRDGTKEFTTGTAPTASVEFHVPGEYVTKGSLILRVDAEDKFGNRLASDTAEVAVAAGFLSSQPDFKKVAKGTNFWTTPWPYIGLGILVAAGGASAYYYGLRPTSDVSVTRVALLPPH